MKLVYIEWLDACKTPETRNLADVSSSGEHFASAGILIEENENAVIFALDVPMQASTFPYRDIETIPRRYITRGPIYFEVPEK